jgi:hypothetical protein
MVHCPIESHSVHEVQIASCLVRGDEFKSKNLSLWTEVYSTVTVFDTGNSFRVVYELTLIIISLAPAVNFDSI